VAVKLDLALETVVFNVALDGVALGLVAGVSSFLPPLTRLEVMVEEVFLLTVGGVEVVLMVLVGAVLLERELRLERGVGDDTTELREDRAERLEDGTGELELDLVEETALDMRALVGFPFLTRTGFGLGVSSSSESVSL